MTLNKLKDLAYNKMLEINNAKKDLSIFEITKKLDIHSQGKTETEAYNNMTDEIFFCLDNISG